jgi:GT2 family glycosyltransferase
MEEIDLCWRLRSRGKGIVCIPQSSVYHVGAATLQRENPRKTFLNFRNNLLMLYKNLPEKELYPVMRIRRILDYLAAIFFIVKGQTANARAVFRARREYEKIQSSFTATRMENMKKTVCHHIPERKKGSILVWYYIKRKRKFSQLSV